MATMPGRWWKPTRRTAVCQEKAEEEDADAKEDDDEGRRTTPTAEAGADDDRGGGGRRREGEAWTGERMSLTRCLQNFALGSFSLAPITPSWWGLGT